MVEVGTGCRTRPRTSRITDRRSPTGPRLAGSVASTPNAGDNTRVPKQAGLPVLACRPSAFLPINLCTGTVVFSSLRNSHLRVHWRHI